MTVKLAVFDCDGTLVDGQASICEAMETAFAAAGLPAPDRHQIRRIVGLSLPQALRHLAPDASDDQRIHAVEAYKEAFRTSRLQGRIQEPLFDGISALLDRLRDTGWQLAVATGKSDRGLYSCLAMHGLSEHFVSLQTADRHPSKPHPAMLEAAMADAGAEPENTAMIGDTTFDIAMAGAANVRAIGVDWGYHTPDELIAEGASAIASTPQAIGDLLL
ncbi:HAD-IA family hydrolase [Pontixanthobacter aquaemixtae]|uniref:HAD-IA family hydrolase n=1 Tax=Pontixanthobacter aquaemixtae TaxID=1958940 RepID=A0A844ZV95_9SPHN|nr:HAD-IA family hydrolase [Pontixanthobacter aquaemixtae]MXO89459.1 HAD-IA family hydrolase [Pontixanthobacter aquaemixtae]